MNPKELLVASADSSFQIRSSANSMQALVLELKRDGDRFGSTVFLQDGAVVTPILRSIEGSDDDRWPASPVVQEVLRHELDEGTFLAGVGMAGTSHWSLAITASADSIVFDYACRLKHTPDFWGRRTR